MTKIQDLRNDNRIMPGVQTRNVSAVNRIARHHSATAGGDVFAFQNHWRSLGWNTGGYHEIILRDGTVQHVYNDNVVTNGVAGHNGNTYHICLVGSSNFTAEQERAFDERCRLAMQRLNIPVKHVLGHNEFPNNPTICPGIDMNMVRNRLGGQATAPAPNPQPVAPPPAPSFPAPTVEPFNRRMRVTAQELNRRKSQNTQSGIVDVLRNGFEFNGTRIARNGEDVNGTREWVEVDGRGWVSRFFLEEVAQTAPTPPPQSSSAPFRAIGTVEFTANGINVRRDTPVTGAVVAQYNRGQRVNYDRIERHNGHWWVSFIGGSGNRNWVAVTANDGVTLWARQV